MTRVLAALAALMLAAVPTAQAQTLQPFQAAVGGYAIGYPRGWEVAAAADGRAVAFFGPPVALRGATFRPNMVLSVTPTPQGVGDRQVVATAEAALAQALPGLRRLGQETVSADDSQPVAVGYYLAEGFGGRLYLVLGVAQRDARLATVLGMTSPDLVGYRTHAGLYRAAILSLRMR
jgi:hypothetical protein